MTVAGEELTNEVSTEISQAPVETQTVTETTPEASPEPAGGTGGDITLDADGNISISDAVVESTYAERTAPIPTVFDEDGTADDEKPISTSPSEPVKPYNTEELARAFMENKIDVQRLPKETRAYYDAIRSEQTKSVQIHQATKEAELDRYLAQPIPKPQQPQPLRVMPMQLNADGFAKLQEAGKTLAARYLNIDMKDFDEYNPNHTNAQAFATNEIKARAEQLHIEQQKTAYQQQMQQFEQHNKAYQEQQKLYRLREYDITVKEFKKHPNWEEIDKKFYPSWVKSLDADAKAKVKGILERGNPIEVKKVMDVVFASYDRLKKPVKKKAHDFPPDLMSSADAADIREARGFADASKLGEMSPEERAAWLIQNKFV